MNIKTPNLLSLIPAKDIEQIEKIRKKDSNNAVWHLCVMALLPISIIGLSTCLFIFIWKLSNPMDFKTAGILIGFYAVLLLIIFSYSIKRIKARIKKVNISKLYYNQFVTLILNPILNSQFENCIYDIENEFDTSLFKESFFYFTDYSTFASAPLIKGSKNGTCFSAAEIKTTQKTNWVDENGIRRTEEYTTFNGLFVALDKPYTYTGISIAESSQLKIINKLARFTSDIKQFKELQQVTLEDPTFSKAFSIYTNDQIGCRYCFTPQVMEQLIMIKQGTKYPIHISFTEHKIFIAIENNAFHTFLSPPVFSKISAQSSLSHIQGLLNNLNLSVVCFNQ